MKFKKALLLFVLLMLTAFALFSCKVGDDGEGSGDSSDTDSGASSGGSSDSTPDGDGSYVWSKGDAPVILLDEYASENLQIKTWVDTLYTNLGGYATVTPDSEAAAEHEISVGRVDRNASVKAYRRLEKMLEDYGRLDSEGWVIYTNGTSCAIAYEGEFAFAEAIKYFNENYLSKESFSPEAGVLAHGAFVTEEYVAEIREARREEGLDALASEIGDEAADALKVLFSIYTDGLYKWMVDLYDTEVGGFYACNSGRNTVGFLPDIQNTAQIINFLENSGLTEGYENIREAVPEEIGKQILEYAISLQSSENGYFYHPQWGDEISTARLGRDLNWATQMIQTFGGRPLYDTPNGVKGTLGAPGKGTGVSGVSHLSGRLSSSSVTAVSKVVAVSKASLPSYLKSLEAWDAYIKGLNLPYNSYNGGNTLASQSGQIKLAGQEYVDHLINYLNSIKNPKTALWEAEDSENDEYYAVNGLMKLSSLYNAFQKPLPDAEAAIESCMAVALKPDGDTYVCSIYNPWITMYYVLLSAERTGGEERVAELREIILPKAADLIKATAKKIADYRIDDGAFATYGRNAAPVNMLTGTVVGCATDPESDVDASTVSSTGVVCNIFNVLGCTEVKLFGKADYKVFKKRWLELGALVKEPFNNAAEPETFDEFSYEHGTVDGGVIIDPGTYVQNTIGDLDKVGENYKWFSSEVVSDPSPSGEKDLCLKAQTFLDNESEKTKADAASATAFSIQGVVRNENCFVFETDVYFESAEGSSCVGEIFFTSAAVRGDHTLCLIITKYTANGKTYFSIGEGYDGLDGVKDSKIASGIHSNEWVNLRIELYKLETEGGLDIKCKVYVNGKYKGTCDAGYVKEGEFADRKVGAVRYSHYRHSETTVYLDNGYLQAINKEYVKEDNYNPGENLGPEKIDFEDYMTFGDTTYIHAVAPVSPDANYSVQSVTGADGEATNAYVYDSNLGGQDTFRLQSYGIDLDAKLTSANAFTYDADMKLEFNPNEPNGEIRVQLGSTGASSYHAYYMLMSLDKRSGKIALKDIGVTYSGSTVITEVENGEWFNMRVEYYYISEAEMLVLTYINNKLVYVSNNYNHNNTLGSVAWPVFKADKHTLPSGSKISGIEKFMFTMPANTDVTIYLDNCIIRRCDLTPPEVKDGDYTSRFDEQISDVGGGNTGGDSSDTEDDDKPGDSTGGAGGGTTTPPTGNDIIDNLPNGTWKD